MRKKFIMIFFITLLFLLLFSASCFASTDYSVFDESSGLYHIVFPDAMKEELGLPSADVPYYFGSEDFYYLLIKRPTGDFDFICDSVNFIENASDNADFDGTYNFRRSTDNNRFKYFLMRANTSEWVDAGYYGYGSYSLADLSSIVVSSDDIYNNVTGELIVPKTVFEEDSGGSDDDGIMKSITVTSDIYNKAFIDSYLNSGKSPFDAFKIIVDYYNDRYPGALLFTSDDLPEYVVLYETYGPDGSSDGYSFLFTEYPVFYQSINASSENFNLICLTPNNDDGSIEYYFNGFQADFFNDNSGFIFQDNRITSYFTSVGCYRFQTCSYGSYVTRFVASNYDIKNIDDGSTVFWASDFNGSDSGNIGGDNSDTSIDYSSSGVFSWISQGFKDLISGISSLIDYLNPASDKFFVYKLIELLGDLLKSLFIPSEERITAIIDTVQSKCDFIETIKISVQSMQDIINNTGTSPKLTINVGATKYTEAQEMTILDFSFYKDYKPYGDLILTGFIYAFFLWRFFISIPNILNASGGVIESGDMVSDISAYQKFGIGRSSSLTRYQNKGGGVYRK